MEPRFKIGTRYMPIGKDYWCEVIEIHRTLDSKGNCVKLRYVSKHQFCGQTVEDYDVTDTTIARAKHE